MKDLPFHVFGSNRLFFLISDIQIFDLLRADEFSKNITNKNLKLFCYWSSCSHPCHRCARGTCCRSTC